MARKPYTHPRTGAVVDGAAEALALVARRHAALVKAREARDAAVAAALDVLAPHYGPDGLSLADVSDALGVSRTTAKRLLTDRGVEMATPAATAGRARPGRRAS